MADDLFKTKKAQMLDFIREKKWVKTHEAISYGLSIFTNRGDRYCRELAEEGKIKRMDEGLKNLRFNNLTEDVWEYIQEK